ncbi:MAG: hydroxymethylbilane synthase [Candidatus Eremiobacteraeota bacterium]|nr:hydroxymethylbilane synthase [Candidatus Eremiobacteraeota bacterium]
MYPIVLNLHGRLVVVVGGGRVAERKIAGLLDAGSSVRMVAPSATAELEILSADGRIEWVRKEFEPRDLDGAALVFATTDSSDVNAAVTEAAHARGILVNDALEGSRGDFATPAIHRNGTLTVAVDTGGASPSLAKRVRDELAVIVDERYADAARALRAARAHVRATLPPDERGPAMRELAARGGSLVCASRGSALALTQTRGVMAQLAKAGIASTVVTISTKGDRLVDRPLTAVGGDGVFVKELELALRDRRADYAVHSCKDLPSVLPGDMEIAAIGERADPRDVYCSEKYPTLDALPRGARIGTSSPRRRALLEALRPDVECVMLRGNVETRLRKLREGEVDALVLAAAGMQRLGVRSSHAATFPTDEFVPAVAQGALAIEMRRGDPVAAALRAAFNHPTTELAVLAERAFLRTLRGGCQAPIGAHARWDEDGSTLVLVAAAGIQGANELIRRTARGAVQNALEADALGVALAEDVLAARLEAAPLSGRIFLLPRTQDRPSRIAPALRDAGAEVVEVTSSTAARSALAERVPHVILFPSSGSVGAIREYLAELRSKNARPVVAAMGPASSAEAEGTGFPPDVVAPTTEVAGFVAAVTRYVLERGVGS